MSKKIKKNSFFVKKVSKKTFGQNYKPINFFATDGIRYFVSEKETISKINYTTEKMLPILKQYNYN